MNPLLKRIVKIFAILAGFITLIILGFVVYVETTWDAPIERPVVQLTASSDSASIARGEFLFKYTATCWICHGEERRIDALPVGGVVEDLSDFGPGFGIYYVPNITPDEETGIGTWTDGEIVRAIREGVGREGNPLFIMPSRAFNGMSDEDALSIAAYLKSLPPVRNPVPDHEYSFVGKVLFALGMIETQPAVTEVVKAPPRGLTEEWGGYVANHVALCTDCHSPLDMDTGQFYEDSLFMGGTFLVGEPMGKLPEEKIDPIWAVGPNLTPDEETGIGTWTEEEFVALMKSGVGKEGKVRVATAMPYPYYKKWDETDIRAVYRYLRTLKPVSRPVPPNFIYSKHLREGSGPARGKALYYAYCRNCHGENGTGAPATKAILADVAPSINDELLKNFIVKGQMNLWMPGFEKTLTSGQLDDVVKFIRSWEAN